MTEFLHYGTPRRSGRYPWGSGDDPYQNNKGFVSYYRELKESGMPDIEIAKAMGAVDRFGKPNTTVLRARHSMALNAVRAADQSFAVRQRAKGVSHQAIGDKLGLSEAGVRKLVKDYEQGKVNRVVATANMLKDEVDRVGGFLDVGGGTSNILGISTTQLGVGIAALQEQGYRIGYQNVVETNGRKRSLKILAKDSETFGKDVAAAVREDRVGTVARYTRDEGASFEIVKPPVNLDSKRLGVRYGNEGGSDADGVIYIRPGVADLSLGQNRYAQVRIAVDGTHYIKGMAHYKDDLPAGIDVMFNTNKKNTGNKLDALKDMSEKIEKDADRPFGAIVRNHYYKDSKGQERQSIINLVNEEGDWSDWGVSLPSQMLSKQSLGLAKQQLDIAYAKAKDEYDTISRLTNPTLKKLLLEKFADTTDSQAVDLKAAAMPRQSTSVILPFKDVKPTEIYAPNYNNGERVALVRFPHGGKFEIAELTVNNKVPVVKKTIGNAIDAVGIHPSVANKLSGADFDGDTVLVIPNDRGSIKSAPALKDLKNFDPKAEYPYYEGMQLMSKKGTQTEMGKISNLINDMTLKGATDDELARAVRHSMVVIDAEKHKLDYKQSEKNNVIHQLKEDYQGGPRRGASTLISRASKRVDVEETRPARVSEGGPIDPETGKKRLVPTGETKTRKIVDSDGKVSYVKTDEPVTVKAKLLAITDDAHTLSSGTPMEKAYATHANQLKALANTARKDYLSVDRGKRDPSAREAYRSETDSLTAKVNEAEKRRPQSRQVELTASVIVRAKRQDNPLLEGDDLRRVKRQANARARAIHQVTPYKMDITPREWEAIQSGALSPTMLEKVFRAADLTQIKTYATPRDAPVMGNALLTRARQMLSSGHTTAEVANALGVATSTLTSAVERS